MARIMRLGLLIAFCGPSFAGDTVREIVSLVPTRPHTYEEMLASLATLEQSDRVSLMQLGRSASGREIPAVAVHHPDTVFGQGSRLFVIARQHGDETSGTEAALAILRHFATSQGELERAVLRHLTIIVVPMANPDGAVKLRRRNAMNVDLNRDWLALSQPETRAICQAVRAWRPHAIMDLHELPRNSTKSAYADNFVETIGAARGVPASLSDQTVGAASSLSEWMKLYGHRVSTYFDQPGRDSRLCHRYFGLRHGIPSFLVEAKTGPGRTLQHRVSIHVLSMLVVANQLVNQLPAVQAAPAIQPARIPELVAPPTAAVARRLPAQPGGPVTVELGCEQVWQEDEGPALQLEALIGGQSEDCYVKVYVDGQLWLVSNMEPHRCLMDAAEFGSGQHDVRVAVVGSDGKIRAQTQRLVSPDTATLAGE